MNESEFIIKVPILRGLEVVGRITEIVGDAGYIGGSFAAWMTAPQVYWEPNDIDIFVKYGEDVQVIVNALAFQLSCEFVSNSDIAFTSTTKPVGWGIQVVRPHPSWKTFPDDIINSFDLDICRAVIIDKDTAFADINAGGRTAKILNVQNPLRQLRRVAKYMARRVEFSDHELYKLFRAWDSLPKDKQLELLQAALPVEAPDEPLVYACNWDDEEWFDAE